MAMPRHVRQFLVVLASMCLLLITLQPVSAQGFFSLFWSGGSSEVVSFNPSHAPGQIIVSFGDKRLYFVHRRGEAISYPIAIPRDKSRWQGVTSVSDKRAQAGPQRRTCDARTRGFPRMCLVATRKIHSECVRCTSAQACIASMERMRPGRLVKRFLRVASVCTTRTCLISIRAFPLERA
jgi:hypothetical protein